MLEWVEIDPDTPPSKRWPCGKPLGRDISVIFVCTDQWHRKAIIQALPIPGALYLLWGEPFMGLRTKRIVAFRFSHQLPPKEEEMHVQYWDNIQCRLIPGCQNNKYLV